MGKIHAARVENSPRLRRVLALLRDRGTSGATSMEIIQEARTAAPAACVAELRDNGYRIDCKQEGRKWRYTLLPPMTMEALQEAAKPFADEAINLLNKPTLARGQGKLFEGA